MSAYGKSLYQRRATGCKILSVIERIRRISVVKPGERRARFESLYGPGETFSLIPLLSLLRTHVFCVLLLVLAKNHCESRDG